MATRPELIEMCRELDIDYDGMSRDDMKDAIRKKIDRLYRVRGARMVSADDMSYELKKFLYTEYNYLFRNRKGVLMDYKGDEIPRSKRSRAKTDKFEALADEDLNDE